MKHSLFILTALVIIGCSSGNDGTPFMAAAPDYTDAQMWYISETGAETDVFYILPTCVRDWSDSKGRTCHYADVHNPDHIAALLPSNELADEIFGKYANFHSRTTDRSHWTHGRMKRLSTRDFRTPWRMCTEPLATIWKT